MKLVFLILLLFPATLFAQTSDCQQMNLKGMPKLIISDGLYEGFRIKEKILFNKNGYITEETEEYSNGRIKIKKKKYSKENQLIEEEEIEDGKTEFKALYTYNSKGEVSTQYIVGDDQPRYAMVPEILKYEYNENGDIIKEINIIDDRKAKTVNPNIRAESYYQYTYDKEKNWLTLEKTTKEMEKKDSFVTKKVTRTIKYF